MKKNVYVKQIFEDGDYKNLSQYNLKKEIETIIKPKNVFVNYKEEKKTNKKKLTKTQLSKLKKHSENHSTKHINLMKKSMLEGNSFNKSHKVAMEKIGK
tara:strand:+ start:3255 stop:3551 length:297 start_codon:yes stop_codon:yes gene_type:complete